MMSIDFNDGDYCEHCFRRDPEPAPEWVQTSERRPDAGRLIVKRWKNGSVWAGVYNGSDKDSSFDEWVYLPC